MSHFEKIASVLAFSVAAGLALAGCVTTSDDDSMDDEVSVDQAAPQGDFLKGGGFDTGLKGGLKGGGFSKVPTEVPSKGYSQIPSKGYSEIPSKGYSEIPSKGYSQIPSKGYSEIPSKGFSKVPSKGYSPIQSQTLSPLQGISPIQGGMSQVGPDLGGIQ